ncbi:MAG: PTS glucitol/sorbitol transporter subunit IIC [Bacillota bacterium]
MDFLAGLASNFIGLFNEGGTVLMGFVTGILPTLIVLMTFVNSIIKMIGEQKVERMAKACSKNIILRYTALPILAMFFLTSPMAFTFGKFLDEKHKAAFYDAAVSFCHPITGLFPHANASEYFVYGGIAAGIIALGLDPAELAIRYFIVGILVILMRGIVTERIVAIMSKEK